MISTKEKAAIWKKISDEFPSDAMMRDLHFIRELMDVIENSSEEPKSLKELSILAREEFIEWLKELSSMQLVL